MNKFPNAYNKPKLTQEDINHLSRPITSNEIEAVMQNLPAKKNSGHYRFTGEFYQTFKELISILFEIER
jgi:hypothetical protein